MNRRIVIEECDHDSLEAGHWCAQAAQSRTVLEGIPDEWVEAAAITICDLDVDFGVKWNELETHYNTRLAESTRDEFRHAARSALEAAVFGGTP